jgi:hypothetical protein
MTRQNALRISDFGRAAGPGFATQSLSSNSLTEGCYRIAPDTTSWLRGLPQHFALARDSSSGRNVVRGVTAAGTVDSIIAGTDWQTAPPNGSNVVLITHRTAGPPVSLRFATTSSRAQAQFGSELRFVPVQRTTCRPQP